MAKITRKLQKIFGGNSSNNGVFGSAADGDPTLSDDPDEIQDLPAWEGGWNDATLSGDMLPTREEDQGVKFVVTRQLAYLMQQGIPEWNAETTYYEDSICQSDTNGQLYISLTNDNLNQDPTSNPDDWAMLSETVLPYTVGDETTNLTTGNGKLTFRMPFDFIPTKVNINVNTAPVGSSIIVDINDDTTSIFSANPQIDDGEKTNVTGVQGTLNGTLIAYDSEMTVDIDQIGSGTPGKGLKIIIFGYRRWNA